MAFGYRRSQGGVVAHQPSLVRGLVGLQLRIARTIELARQHLLFFGLAQPISPSFGNASGADASTARARALSWSICRIKASTLSNFSSARMKPMKATSSLQP